MHVPPTCGTDSRHPAPGLDVTALPNTFRLAGEPASVPKARRWIAGLLRGWELPDDTRDAARLLISELVTNAVVHTDSEEIVCSAGLADTLLYLEVRDQGTAAKGPPRRRDPGADAEDGRGLLIVTDVSEDFGVRARDNEAGHTIWATLRTTR
ncbi:ATP-binding protein [Streptomyces sp. H27-D2]|uniref:ATP-binding protein n=1 Tax=Streptomyces sp. H27-D2 TaxID=3046304 RepID=UPI002DB8AE17|nr:ATP-binding protein [Streptomyces sp. H27-D2]MEC4020401.1 ATP-binding protein [Streptomyces sp. H27-D2]